MTFWPSFWPNLAASALAVILGIPTALWIDRLVKRADSLRVLQSKKEDERKILKLIDDELNYNRRLILPAGRRNTIASPVRPLKYDLWEALKSSGGLQAIADVSLVNKITSAYFLIKALGRMEQLAYEQRFSAVTMTIIGDSGKTTMSPEQMILQDARSLDTSLLDALSDATKSIAKRLSDLEPPAVA